MHRDKPGAGRRRQTAQRGRQKNKVSAERRRKQARGLCKNIKTHKGILGRGKPVFWVRD